MNLLDLDKKHIWHPYTSLQPAFAPLLIERAEGVYLFTSDNRKILDAISSWWVNIHGHGNPAILDAMSHQLKSLDHVMFAGFTHEPAVQLATNLLTILPSNQLKIFFSDNGSTAVEVAIKIALQFWRNKGIAKNRIIALEGAYHGDTFGAMSVGSRGLFTAAFEHLLFHVDFIPFPDQDNSQVVLDKFERLCAQGDVAAFIFEPLVQGAGGMRMYSPQILERLLQIATHHGIVSIADEVFTGFGRTGKNFAVDHLTQPVDIITLSKGITGGVLPLGATACAERIVEAFDSPLLEKTLFHGHSFTAYALACAAANASIAILKTPDCQNDIQRISSFMAEAKAKLGLKKGVVRPRNLGTILALDIESDSKTDYQNPMRNRIYAYFLERNILLRPLGNTLYMVPPYVIQTSDLNRICETIIEFTDSL